VMINSLIGISIPDSSIPPPATCELPKSQRDEPRQEWTADKMLGSFADLDSFIIIILQLSPTPGCMLALLLPPGKDRPG
jgi:hypothetical protein